MIGGQKFNISYMLDMLYIINGLRNYRYSIVDFFTEHRTYENRTTGILVCSETFRKFSPIPASYHS